MAGLLVRRAGFSLLSLLLVSACLFFLTRAIPDSPALIVLGQDATETQIAQFEHDHGLDRPVVVQYALWVGGIVTRGDLGRLFPFKSHSSVGTFGALTRSCPELRMPNCFPV